MPSRLESYPFLWGASTSSHQIEGNNQLNDWWQWEKQGKTADPSGAACDHFNRMDEDVELIKSLGHNSYRFSIEWSRVEPQEGVFDEKVLQQYGKLIESLRKNNIEPIVTLHHFTNPLWFTEKGGWEFADSTKLFSNYVNKVVSSLGAQVTFWITINEPMVFLYHGYVKSIWPPGKCDIGAAMTVFRNMLLAHQKAYRDIHELYGDREVYVSVAKHMIYLEPYKKSELLDVLSSGVRGAFFNDLFLKAATSGFLFFPGLFCEFLPEKEAMDFIALNYYSRHLVQFGGWDLLGVMGNEIEPKDRKNPCETNMMGWEVFAQGLYQVLKKLGKYHKPIMITENGICTESDEQRVQFIESHTRAISKAMQEGIDVRGYMHWSLLDNFEWDHGFRPRFGIVDVDFETFQRKIKGSAHVLGDTCRKLVHEYANLSKRAL